MTETATVSWPLMHTKVAKLGSSGPLIPGMSAKVINSEGVLAKEGERGELWVKGPCLAMGYYENPKAYVGPIRLLSYSHIFQNGGNFCRWLVTNRG